MIIHRFFSSVVGVHAVLGGIVLGLAGCNAFNPAFLGVVAPEAAATFATIPNAPGYVVLALQNNVRIDGPLLNHLRPQLDLSPAEESALRARIRMRLRITHSDGTFQTVEMISGSGEFVDPSFNAQASPDLLRNTLTNVVVRCDVASIQLEPGSNIEVFIPVPLEIWELVEVDMGEQAPVIDEIQRGTIAPQFRPLELDEVDEDGNVILQRNVDVRDVLSPTTNVVCGSVVPVVVSGVLSVPFFTRASANPSYDRDDADTVAGIGGRYQFRVSAQ